MVEKDKIALLPQCWQFNTKSHAPIAVPVITFVSLLFLGYILTNNTSMVDIEAQTLQMRLTKLDKDLLELRCDGNQTWAWEQYQRKKLVRKVCENYDNPKEFQKTIHFIMDPKVRIIQKCPCGKCYLPTSPNSQSKTIYCYNHKAGSSTWMAAYSELVDDINFVRRVRKNELYYK